MIKVQIKNISYLRHQQKKTIKCLKRETLILVKSTKTGRSSLLQIHHVSNQLCYFVRSQL